MNTHYRLPFGRSETRGVLSLRLISPGAAAPFSCRAIIETQERRRSVLDWHSLNLAPFLPSLHRISRGKAPLHHAPTRSCILNSASKRIVILRCRSAPGASRHCVLYRPSNHIKAFHFAHRRIDPHYCKHKNFSAAIAVAVARANHGHLTCVATVVARSTTMWSRPSGVSVLSPSAHIYITNPVHPATPHTTPPQRTTSCLLALSLAD